MTSLSQLAAIAGIPRKDIANIKKNLGITNKVMTKEEEDLVLEEAKRTKAYLDETKAILDQEIIPTIVKPRRIDQKEGSSLQDLLQDAKERYVENEIIIKKLNNELNQMEKLFRGNSNGTFQCMPQLAMIDKYQNMNYKLRSQIADFEDKLGKVVENVEDNPFI